MDRFGGKESEDAFEKESMFVELGVEFFLLLQ
jgi:hypothetical protein